MEEISVNPDKTKLLIDIADPHAKVMISLYNSMLHFNRKNYKEATTCLNEIINTVSFKDYFHENINVKLTLAYFYILMEEYDMVENILKGISRKIKTEHLVKYDHVLHLIKAFDLEINKNKDMRTNQKKRDMFTLFLANNTTGIELLGHLIPELKRNYQR